MVKHFKTPLTPATTPRLCRGVNGYLFSTNTSYHRVTNAKPSAPRCKRGAVLHSFMPALQASNTSNHNSQGMFAFISAHQHNQRHLRSIPSQFRPFNKSFSIACPMKLDFHFIGVNFQFSIN